MNDIKRLQYAIIIFLFADSINRLNLIFSIANKNDYACLQLHACSFLS